MLVLEGPARALGEAGSLEDSYEGIEGEDEDKDDEKGDNEEEDNDEEKEAEQENLSFPPLLPLEHVSGSFLLRSSFSTGYSFPDEPFSFAHQPSSFIRQLSSSLYQPSLFLHQPFSFTPSNPPLTNILPGSSNSSQVSSMFHGPRWKNIER